MRIKREFNQSPINQGEDEEVSYRLDISTWPLPTSDPVTKIYDMDFEDLSSTLLDGTTVIDGDYIILPKIKDLESGQRYRVEVLYKSNTNTFEAWGYIIGER